MIRKSWSKGEKGARVTIVLTLICLFIFLVGCVTNKREIASVIESPYFEKEIDLLVDDIWGGVWLDDALIVSVNGDNRYDGTLWKIPHDSPEDFYQLELPPHPSCGERSYNGFERPQRLPDGRVSYFVLCRPTNDDHEHRHLMALDPETLESEQLLLYEIPLVLLPSISWRADMATGIATTSNYLNSWIFRVTLEDWEPLELGFKQVYDVIWLPDSSSIAFLAAPEQGLNGFSLVDALFNIYLMEPDGKNIRPILKEIYKPGSLTWSLDSQWLLFEGTIREGIGIWAFNVDTSELILVSERKGSIGGWLPDGHRLLVWYKEESEDIFVPSKQFAVIYDLEPILAGDKP